MKKTLALVLPLLLAALSARADKIWYEGFQYTNGPLTNVSSGVWIKTSGTANPSDMLVANSNLQVSATGGTLSRQDDCYRPLATAPGSPYTNSVQLVYASFTVICTNLPNASGSYFATFYNTGAGYFGRVQAFTNGTTSPNTWRLGVTANSLASNPSDGGYPVDLALNTPYQVVEELDPVNLYAATVWINPVNINQTGTSPTETHYTSSDGIGAASTSPVNAYVFRQASSFGNSFFLITNLTLATTFAEAATNTWTTNAVAPTIVYQPPTVISNFPGANVSISAVANGQGLGNLTYQWQKSATPDNASPSNYSNPNGNSHVLAINNAQTSDDGYYSLVVTTPYGLSTTSAVTQVVILDGPYPPVFTLQPKSQSTYKGPTVTFSASVIGPPSGGTPVFTWYSNNVVVTAGQMDSGYSSSYVLNSVLPINSATYKVGVTNSYGGIISSNAVLTVINPAAVSIAYLRTLVDPLNGYNPTNSPPTIAYQITGTVTTLTNITSGNTSSYYLQDGTGGINIFATFGSTFRPARGDVVTFIGVLSGFSSGLELYADLNPSGSAYPFTSVADIGTAAVPAPISVGFDVTTNLNNMNYNLGGSLVVLHDVYFGTNSGYTLSTTANDTISVTNSSGQQFKLFFAYYDLDTAGQTLPSYAYSVSGVMYGINTNWSVAVTRFADIVTTPPPAPIPLNVNLSGSTLTFTWSDASFYLQNATNVTGPYKSITGAAPGFMTNTTSGPQMFYRLYHP